MTKPVASREVLAARGKVRIGSWMVIAGSLGAILALLTYIDVWDVSDTKPSVGRSPPPPVPCWPSAGSWCCGAA